MGLEPTADLDLRSIDQGFSDMLRASKDLRPVFKGLAPVMKQDQLEHGRLQEGPEGKWEPLAKSTRAKRRKRKIFSKRFIKAFSVEISRLELASIHKIEWASAHNDGLTVGHGSKLPKRTMQYMSDQFLAIAIPKMRDHVAKAFAKRGKVVPV